MTIRFPFKYLSLMVLAAGLAVGCATAPAPKEEPDAAPGPSPAVTKALNDARAAIAQVKELNFIWRDTEKFFADAEKAAKEGDDAQAISLANRARQEAVDATNQYYHEKAVILYEDLLPLADRMNAQQRDTLQRGYQAIRNKEGKRAYDLLSPLNAAMAQAMSQYTVVRGDSLWKISGRSDIYNNPYQWPLIYKANSDQIRDADLIHPGQRFNIDMNPSAAEVSAAINHARTRGAWSLGVVEEADKRYLGTLRLR